MIDLYEQISMIIESHDKDFDFPVHEMAEDLLKFMKKELNYDRDPKIFFENSQTNAYNILGKTGYYDPDKEEIHVFITKRHPKDILRSIAHEVIHHAQLCEGRMDDISAASDENYILHDENLKDLEEDAFSRGNLIFRKWEAYKKMEIADHIKEHFARVDESKKKKRKLSIKQYKKAKKMATSMEKKQGYSAEKAHKIAFAQVQKESLEHIMSENENKKQEKEVEVNEILKNSHYYRPEDRACNETYTARDELIFQEMLKKFGIKK